MRLSTGREIYTNEEIVGIDDELAVHEGYDGGIIEADVTEPSWIYDDEEREEWLKKHLTSAEMVELADIMIARWTAYRDKARQFPSNA